MKLSPPISSITAYDYPSARLADEAGIQMILVGDSLGMVVAGHPDTTSVTLDQMAYHTEMVARGVSRAIVVADLPIDTYRDPEETVSSATRLVESGADAVKLEGGLRQTRNIRALRRAGIEVVGHLGMLPQRVREEGGYRKKGKTPEQAEELLAAARALEEAGVFCVILESVVAEVATRITETLGVPTIGIGAGTGCSGQIRVWHDVVGAFPWFVPPFAKVYADVAGETRRALVEYRAELA